MKTNNKEMLAQVLAGKTWKLAPTMPALPANHTSADVVLAGLTEYISEAGLTALKYSDINGDIRQIVIVYEEHRAAVFRVAADGVVKTSSFKKNDLEKGRHKINLIHGCVHVNELVVRVNNIANGVIDSYNQEYNHHCMVVLAPETFGPDAGSMCTCEQNQAHRTLCTRLYKELGIVANVKSYYNTVNSVYSLLGLKQITLANVVALNPQVIDRVYHF